MTAPATQQATIYHNNRCSTSRNALQSLTERGYKVTVIEYLATPPDRATLQKLIADAGLTPAQAIRSKEALFTELGLDAPGTTDEQRLSAMLAHPILINRPFVTTQKGTRLARPASALDEIL